MSKPISYEFIDAEDCVVINRDFLTGREKEIHDVALLQLIMGMSAEGRFVSEKACKEMIAWAVVNMGLPPEAVAQAQGEDFSAELVSAEATIYKLTGSVSCGS